MPNSGKPRPAARAVPGPVAATPEPADGAPDVIPAPSRAEGSAGGGPSTDRDTMVTPRRMIRPRVRFSSEVVGAALGALLMGQLPERYPVVGALIHDLVGRLFMRRNSSVSARTIFMCYPFSVPAYTTMETGEGVEPYQMP